MRVDIGGCRLFFDVEGIGWPAEETELHPRRTVILVHGGPGTNDHSHYKPMFGELADIAQVIYYDHRGNGRSDRSEPAKWNLGQWAEDLKCLCDALGIERPLLIGTSFGGFVVQEYLARHPDHPAGVILCSTSARLCFSRVLSTMERLGGPEARDIAERFWCGGDPAAWYDAYVKTCCPLYLRVGAADTAQIPAIVARTRINMDVMHHFVKPGGEAHTFNLLPGLSSVRCPTLVLAGDDDPITTIADAEDMVAAIPSAWVQYERFGHCGHPTYADAPLRTFRLIREFLSACGARSLMTTKHSH